MRDSYFFSSDSFRQYTWNKVVIAMYVQMTQFVNMLGYYVEKM